MQIPKCKTKQHFVSQLIFYSLYCFPHYGIRGLLSEIDKNWKPFVTASDAWSYSKVFLSWCPSYPLLFSLNGARHKALMMYHVPAWKWLLPGGGKITFQWFLFLLVMALIFPALTWRLKCAQHFRATGKHIFSMPVFMKKVKEA